jgi:hypothetical protein
VGLAAPLFWSSCGEPPAEGDLDKDGFTLEEGDCADLDPNRFPGAQENCNRVDDDCNGIVDDPFDLDRDGASICTPQGDCNPLDPSVFPGNTEVEDGVDNDCDGLVDNNLSSFDDDGDGLSDDEGDCDDNEPFVSPEALEFPNDTVDNDCDGQTDEALLPCDGGALNVNNALDVAKAIGLCNGEVINARFINNLGGVSVSDPTARALVSSFGNGGITAFEGAKMLHLSTGLADTAPHSPGTSLDNANEALHPDPRPDPADGCGVADPPHANDYTELELTLKVPVNALSFSFRFQFFSAEFPRFECDEFDDTFLALLDSGAFSGNISFDGNGDVISLNSGFFDICEQGCPLGPQSLSGTGYDPRADDQGDGGATRPLTTTAAVIPGEIISLRFIIFDEGEGNGSFGHLEDSSVLIDQFVWRTEPVEDPNTQP